MKEERLRDMDREIESERTMVNRLKEVIGESSVISVQLVDVGRSDMGHGTRVHKDIIIRYERIIDKRG